MTILEDLYNGNINPCELEHINTREDYKTATAHVIDARDEFEKTLSEVQQYLFENYSKEPPRAAVIRSRHCVFLVHFMVSESRSKQNIMNKA